MPASLSIPAGTTRACSPVSSGRNLSDCLLIPPPTMMSCGDSSASMCSRYSLTFLAQCFQLMSCAVLARSEARSSASLPRISRCPNSVFGTRTPSMNSALPIPVPSVTMCTVPGSPFPAPNVISATPAASASFSSRTSCPAALDSIVRASSPIHFGFRLAAVRVTPLITTPGKVTPVGPDQEKASTSLCTTSATAFGTAGRGVAIFTRSATKVPVSRSTGAALIPVPPISMPSACMLAPYPSRTGPGAPLNATNPGGAAQYPAPAGKLRRSTCPFRACVAAERGRLMRWAKVLMIAVGALIAFIVLESVFRLLQWAVIALVIGVIIAVAVKARSQYRLAREHRAQVREEKAQRKAKVTDREPSREVVAAPEWAIQDVPPPRHASVAEPRQASVEDELARMKREMGAP